MLSRCSDSTVWQSTYFFLNISVSENHNMKADVGREGKGSRILTYALHRDGYSGSCSSRFTTGEGLPSAVSVTRSCLLSRVKASKRRLVVPPFWSYKYKLLPLYTCFYAYQAGSMVRYIRSSVQMWQSIREECVAWRPLWFKPILATRN